MSSDVNLLGRLALHYKLLTRDQLVESLQQQEREGHRRRIGDLWVENGWMTQARFEQLLRAQREYEERLRSQTAAATAPSPQVGASAAPAAAAPPTPTAGEPALASLAEGPPPSIELVSAAPAASSPSVATTAATAPPSPAQASPTASPANALAQLLTFAAEQRASDLHLHADLPVRLRIDGDFRPLPGAPLSPDESRQLIAAALTPAQREAVERHGQVDFAYTLAGVGRFRANVYRQQRGWDGVFRVIPA
ncbi:MAG TPA: hypothetical protein VFS60_00720, partial [Thermoanaerobaculia bacterium]|nr:hypothetical protein [Thermoanaerobaculia bacterium]